MMLRVPLPLASPLHPCPPPCPLTLAPKSGTSGHTSRACAEVWDFGPYGPGLRRSLGLRGTAHHRVGGYWARYAAGPVDNSRAAGTEHGSLSTVPLPLPPLPASLQGRAFTLVEARAAMVSQARLEAADLVRPTWGVRAHDEARTVDELAHTVGLA